MLVGQADARIGAQQNPSPGLCGAWHGVTYSARRWGNGVTCDATRSTRTMQTFVMLYYSTYSLPYIMLFPREFAMFLHLSELKINLPIILIGNAS